VFELFHSTTTKKAFVVKEKTINLFQGEKQIFHISKVGIT